MNRITFSQKRNHILIKNNFYKFFFWMRFRDTYEEYLSMSSVKRLVLDGKKFKNNATTALIAQAKLQKASDKRVDLVINPVKKIYRSN